MTDKCKIINELCKYIAGGNYINSDYVDCVKVDTLQCAVELLKEQEALEKRNEPIKPELIMTTGAGVPMSHCPNCSESINQYRHPKFCGNCGQAVKWE